MKRSAGYWQLKNGEMRTHWVSGWGKWSWLEGHLHEAQDKEEREREKEEESKRMSFWCARNGGAQATDLADGCCCCFTWNQCHECAIAIE